MPTAPAPHAYPIAGSPELSISADYEPDGCCHVWRLTCPHGGEAALRLPCGTVQVLYDRGDLDNFIWQWWQREGAGFAQEYECSCGLEDHTC